MSVRCPIVAAAVLLLLQPANAQDSDAKSELIQLLGERRNDWSSGYMEATVAGMLGKAEIKAWWRGDKSRREYRRLDSTLGTPNLFKPRIHVLGPDAYCSYSVDSLTVRIEPTARFSNGVVENLKVLPSELWLEVIPGKRMERWIESSPGAAAVYRRPDGGYSAFFLNKEEVSLDQCEKVIAAGGSVQQISFENDGGGIHGLFDERGLPIRIEWIGNKKKNVFRVEWEWSDDPVPFLRSKHQIHSSDSGKTFHTEHLLVVKKATTQLPKDAPSFKLPPDELPVGVKIEDSTGDVKKTYYLGGEEGRKIYNANFRARIQQRMQEQQNAK